ncbi:hypothetical protein D039_2155A, partial [Vibrio parahaemolyticus EKP-028]
MSALTENRMMFLFL